MKGRARGYLAGPLRADLAWVLPRDELPEHSHRIALQSPHDRDKFNQVDAASRRPHI